MSLIRNRACLYVPCLGAALLVQAFALAPARGEDSLRPSQRSGMGAITFNGGTMFRVWAPNAKRVFVSGDFNGWKRSELASEGNGNFSADVPGAKRNDQYKLVIDTGKGEHWRSDPRSQRQYNSNGNSVIHDPNAYEWKCKRSPTPARNEAVIYEMHVGTFHDTKGKGRGDWESAIAKLDHLKELGVNLIELMPPTECGGHNSKGYNPSHPFAPAARHGSPEHLKRFIDEAGLRGIGVIMDVVHNHYGPGDLSQSLWRFDGASYGKGGVYFYTDNRIKTPWGPRPDYGRRQVRDFIRDAANMWLREYRCAGLRWDATKEIRTAAGQDNPEGRSMLRWINKQQEREFPWKFRIAEDMCGDSRVTSVAGAGGLGFNSQWDPGFVHPVQAALAAPKDEHRNMFAVRNAIQSKCNGQVCQRVIYTENHDEVSNGKMRVPEQIAHGKADGYFAKKRSTLGAGILLTSPGIPMLFQGQEFLEDGYFTSNRQLDWKKAERHAGIVNLYRDLIRLRRNWYNNTRGLKGDNVNVFHVNNSDKVVAYHRWDRGGAGDDVVIIANFSDKTYSGYEIGLPRGGRWHVRLNSDWKGYSSDFHDTLSHAVDATAGARDGMGFGGRVGIGPYSIVILSQ